MDQRVTTVSCRVVAMITVRRSSDWITVMAAALLAKRTAASVAAVCMPFNYSYWNFKGYLRRHVCPNIDDRRIAAYRWVFREIHGRDVKPGHDIHHINHNPQDDSSDNLEELSNSQHASHHISDDNPMWRPEVAAKISEHMALGYVAIIAIIVLRGL